MPLQLVFDTNVFIYFYSRLEFLTKKETKRLKNNKGKAYWGHVKRREGGTFILESTKLIIMNHNVEMRDAQWPHVKPFHVFCLCPTNGGLGE